MILNEDSLKKVLKQSNKYNVYFIYGNESFLVKTYMDRILKKHLSDSDRDFNLVRINGVFSIDTLLEAVESLPVFAPLKVVLLQDIDYDKLDNDTIKSLEQIIGNVPESTVLIMSSTTVILDKKKAKVKKLISAADKAGAVCEFDYMSASKIAEMIMKKAAKRAVTISRDDALYVAELTLRNLTLISIETDKLCDYAGTGGEITRHDIDMLVSKQLDAGIYELAGAMASGNREKAFLLLSDLNSEGYEPVIILSALSGAFVDFYRAFLGIKKGASQSEIAAAFFYPANRAWAIGKAVNTAKRIGMEKIRTSLYLLSKADLRLKSSPVAKEIILQQALVEIMETI